MQPYFRKSKTSGNQGLKIGFLVVVLAGLLGVLLWMLFFKDAADSSLLPEIAGDVEGLSMVSAVEPPVELPDNSSATLAETPALPAQPIPGQYLNLPAGNMEEMTLRQAEYEALQLKVKIAREEAELEKLKPSGSAVPQVVSPASSDKPLDKSSGPPAVNPVVVAVQSFDGKSSATVSTSEGLRTLRVGDSFGLGRVERISFEGVHVRFGENVQLYAVEE